jgi:UDP-hydrolysing UDP-N-acetyl-D-glucosamine 2-epimerase
MLGVCSAALMLGIPIAHIHGGESTEGLIDEAVRHAVTKMSHLHFTAADPYRRRVIQLGESPGRVFRVGGLGVDAALSVPFLSRAAVEKNLGLALRPETYLVTYHPVTLDKGRAAKDMRNLLLALGERREAAFVFTLPGAEAESEAVATALREFAGRHPGRAVLKATLGTPLYLSTLRFCTALVGNSSSGLLEAPTFGLPALNIGARQRGRLRAASVLDCAADRRSIRLGLARIRTPAFKNKAMRASNPYGRGGAAAKIAAILNKYPLQGLLMKRFHDL